MIIYSGSFDHAIPKLNIVKSKFSNMSVNTLFKVCKMLGIVLLISMTASAQQPNPLVDKFEEFKILGKVQDQEKFYNDLIKKQPINNANQKIYNAFRAELAIN